MNYIIVSLISLRAMERSNPHAKVGVFFQKIEGELQQHATWTDKFTEAKLFDTEAEAWDFAYKTWGGNFADSCFMVASIKEAALRDVHNRKMEVTR